MGDTYPKRKMKAMLECKQCFAVSFLIHSAEHYSRTSQTPYQIRLNQYVPLHSAELMHEASRDDYSFRLNRYVPLHSAEPLPFSRLHHT